jgi:uncharacterized cupin superfamily protein
LRYGEEKIPLVEGDYVHLPAESGKAHQVVNTSAAATIPSTTGTARNRNSRCLG